MHSARTAHVLVVDSLRYDIGVLVRDAIAAQSAKASLTAEMLLWSALPTTTFRQLETLARGMDALRAPAADDGEESPRGRGAESVRRLRVGSRELYKLDVAASLLANLEGSGGLRGGSVNVGTALDELAAVVAAAVARHLETLPPRTLVLVLGDHGFCLDRRGRITHGGASPEEVLVPAFAYVVSDLH